MQDRIAAVLVAATRWLMRVGRQVKGGVQNGASVGYFDYIAKQSFKSAPSGKRLFYRGGAWSRPYLVPDQATEQRLYIRQLWLMRLLLGMFILGQPFLFLLVPKVIREPLWFLGYLIAVTVVSGVAGHLLFRGPLRGLQRAPSRLPIRAFYAEMAHRQAARSRSGSSAPWVHHEWRGDAAGGTYLTRHCLDLHRDLRPVGVRVGIRSLAQAESRVDPRKTELITVKHPQSLRALRALMSKTGRGTVRA